MSLIIDALNKAKEEAAKKNTAAALQAADSEVDREIRVYTSFETKKEEEQDSKKDFSKIFILLLWGLLAAGLIAGILGVWMFSVRSQSLPEKSLQVLPSPAPALFESKPVTEDSWSPINLEGIFMDGKDPVCLVDGKILHQGDVWKGKKVLEITESAVIFEGVGGGVFKISPQ